MKLSKKALQEKAAELVCPPGTYEAKLNSVSWTDKPSGMWAVLVYRTDKHELHSTFLLQTARQDLEALNLDHMQRLLQAVEAKLGIDEVEDLGAALADMKGRPVSVEVYHRKGSDGRTRPEISAWRAVG